MQEEQKIKHIREAERHKTGTEIELEMRGSNHSNNPSVPFRIFNS